GDLKLSSYNRERGVVHFEGYDTVDDAKPLTNAYLYTTKEAGEAACNLGEGEYFWYQIIGLEVIESGEKLGTVKEIERLAGTDYLQVKTSQPLVESGLPKSFLIPYIERYVERVDLEKGQLYTVGAKEILEAS
ncbi:MAG: ribosome maturation factor RimM, partial [Hydrogenimonas sp.]|nr:ribosome maturation factor RimM [Hydrogenimonas sp.]